MTDPTPQITCFVQTNMPGMAFGEIVTLVHTPYVDKLIEGGRLIAESDPIYAAVIAANSAQPTTWDLLDTAASAASPAEPVTPSTVALGEPEDAVIPPSPDTAAPEPVALTEPVGEPPADPAV